MTKDEAIKIWGEEAVEEGRYYYETDFDKVPFAEDSWSEDCCPAAPWDVFERCSRAFRNLYGIQCPAEGLVDQWWETFDQ